MIAQGEFVEIVRGKSDKRKDIFRKIFKTDVYNKIILKFKDIQKEYNELGKQAKLKFQTKITTVQIPAEYLDADRAMTLKNNIINTEASKVNIAYIEEFIEHLEKICKLEKDKLSLDEKEYADLKIKNLAINEQYAKAEELTKTFNSLENASNELSSKLTLKDTITNKTKLQQDITDAYEILPQYERWSETAKNLDIKEKQLKELEILIPSLKEETKVLEETSITKQSLFNGVSKEYQDVLRDVRETINTIKEIEDKNNKLSEINSKLTKLEESKRFKVEDSKQLKLREQNWRKEESTLIDVPLKRAEAKADLDKLNDIIFDLNEISALKQKINKQETDILTQKTQYAKLSEDYTSKLENYNQIQLAFYNAQAGLLAKNQLVVGKPCPVCGSIHHPSPCILKAEYQNITKEAVEESSGLAEKSRTVLADASVKLGKLNSLYQESLSNLEDKFNKLCSKIEGRAKNIIDDRYYQDFKAKQLSLNLFKDYLNKTIQAKETEILEYSKKEKILETIRESLKNVGPKLQTIDEEIKGIEKDINSLREDFVSTKNLISKQESDKKYVSVELANEALNRIKAIYLEKENESKEAKVNFETKNNEYHIKKGTYDKLVDEIPGIKLQLTNLLVNYQNILKEKACEENAWKGVVNNYSRNDINALKIEIDSYNQKVAELTGAINNAKKNIGNEAKPDLEAIFKTKTELNGRYDEFGIKLNDLNHSYKGNSEVLKDVVKYMADSNKLIKSANIVDSLNTKLQGNGKKLDIETFAQRYYLERILNFANKRFLDMSAGQFLLKLKDIDDMGKQSQEGLDIMVYSTVTGKTREASTLSGGESFMAALSIALGIADEIKEKSGAVNLDMMFIDEGFGSLSNSARDEAVKVLKQMSESSKIIGIISHVTELKQQIDDQLIVTKDDKGSHVKWVIS